MEPFEQKNLVSRREAIAVLASTAVLPLIAACAGNRAPAQVPTDDASALALLDQVGDNLLRLSPESAT